MATNQMRREAAKRKLERQQERRAAQQAKRRRMAVLTSAGTVVVVVVGVVLLITQPWASSPEAPTGEAAAAASGECTFATTPDAAAKAAPMPTVTNASTTGTAAVTLTTEQGAIPLTLDRASAPCAVESFLSLTAAGYFDGTPCHRLTTGEGLKVLQCGDPTGTGTGGPGYTVNDEPPIDLAMDPAGRGAVYPRGTVAMARTQAPNSAGSQFFLVYADSVLPPEYAVLGRIGEEGLSTLDLIAAAGSDESNGPGDGRPVAGVTLGSATVS